MTMVFLFASVVGSAHAEPPEKAQGKINKSGGGSNANDGNAGGNSPSDPPLLGRDRRKRPHRKPGNSPSDPPLLGSPYPNKLYVGEGSVQLAGLAYYTLTAEGAVLWTSSDLTQSELLNLTFQADGWGAVAGGILAYTSTYMSYQPKAIWPINGQYYTCHFTFSAIAIEAGTVTLEIRDVEDHVVGGWYGVGGGFAAAYFTGNKKQAQIKWNYLF